MQNEEAYDLSIFENREEKPARPRVTVAQGKKGLTKARFHSLNLIFLGAIVLALIFSVLASRAKLTELSGSVAEKQAALVEAQSDFTYLNLQLDSKISVKNVEEYATQRLGLIKMDKSQIEYITLESENKIERPESKFSSIWEMLSTGFMSAMEYLIP
ncbi:MAG: hypothetical protein PHG02_03845 [Oscillospiraceae bacterium]|nr:hypothetical protein [Oscillospiraceae bacterium]